jgi:integrase
MLIRVCTAYAIEYGLMHKDKVLNTDPREMANYGWKNLKVSASKQKNVLDKLEETNIIELMKENGDHEFADEFAWLVDIGMRYESEMLTFSIKDINWKKKTINFHRGKTNTESGDLPLSKRAFSIASRYRDVALQKTSQRMFSHSKHQLEALFKKYRLKSEFADFTPYVTRHMFGTRLGERGVNPKIIAKMMGHACVETAQKYYIKATTKGMERAMKLTELSDEQFDDYLEHQKTMLGHNSKGLI